MHRKKPRKPAANPPEKSRHRPLASLLPTLPATGAKRIALIAAMYGAMVTIISLLAVSSAVGTAWLMRGTPQWSGPWLPIMFFGAAIVILPAMYLINGFEGWRRRSKRSQ